MFDVPFFSVTGLGYSTSTRWFAAGDMIVGIGRTIAALSLCCNTGSDPMHYAVLTII